MTSLRFTGPRGETYEFDPDLDYLKWPAGLDRAVLHMAWAERLVLEQMCWDILHALSTEEGS